MSDQIGSTQKNLEPQVIRKNDREAILITGTGRCGTTFLMKIFVFLKFESMYNEANYRNHLSAICQAGLESTEVENVYVQKNPVFMNAMQWVNRAVCNFGRRIQVVIIPIRKFSDAAASRAHYGSGAGGLWGARDVETQKLFFASVMAEYIQFVVANDVKTKFLDFNRMVSRPDYLFEQLADVFSSHNVSYDEFLAAYNRASEDSKTPVGSDEISSQASSQTLNESATT